MTYPSTQQWAQDLRTSNGSPGATLGCNYIAPPREPPSKQTIHKSRNINNKLQQLIIIGNKIRFENQTAATSKGMKTAQIKSVTSV